MVFFFNLCSFVAYFIRNLMLRTINISEILKYYKNFVI